MSKSTEVIIEEMISSITKIKANAIFTNDGEAIIEEANKLLSTVTKLTIKITSLEYKVAKGRGK